MPMFNLYCNKCLISYHLCMCFCVFYVILGYELTLDCQYIYVILSCAVSGIGMIMFRSKLHFIAIL